MMQLPQILHSLVITVGVCGLLCNGEQVVNDLSLQAVTNNTGKMTCFKLEPCSITYLRSHEVSREKFKARTMYQLCLVPPDGTTVLPLEVLYFQNGNESLSDCYHGRGNTDYNRFRISQNGSDENIVFECNDGRIGKQVEDIAFTKPPLTFTHLTGPVEDEGFCFKIDFSGEPRCTFPPHVNGGWSEWSCWSECTHSCGGGSRSKKRKCDSPKPEHGGEDCVGNVTVNDQCNSQPCAVNGGLSEWSSWSECTQTCGGGSHSRERRCNSPKPEHGGEDCVGDVTDSGQCNCHPCTEAASDTWNTTTIITTVCCVIFGLALIILISLRCISRENFAKFFELTPQSEVKRLKNKVKTQEATIGNHEIEEDRLRKQVIKLEKTIASSTPDTEVNNLKEKLDKSERECEELRESKAKLEQQRYGQETDRAHSQKPAKPESPREESDSADDEERSLNSATDATRRLLDHQQNGYHIDYAGCTQSLQNSNHLDIK